MLSFTEFEKRLDEKCPKRPSNQRQRTYLILHFWSPLRKSEIFDRKFSDFQISEDALTIHLQRKKKKYAKASDEEPLKIPLAFPLMEEVVAYLQKKKREPDPKNPDKIWVTEKNYWAKDDRPWKISPQTAWTFVNSVFKGYFPHAFRFRYITSGLEDPLTSFDELVAKTGLHIITIQRYIKAGFRHQDTFDQRMLARVKAEMAGELVK